MKKTSSKSHAVIFGEDGAKEIARFLLNTNSLQNIGLRRNNIGTDGVNALMKALAFNNSLTALNMMGNDDAGEAELLALHSALYRRRKHKFGPSEMHSSH